MKMVKKKDAKTHHHHHSTPSKKYDKLNTTTNSQQFNASDFERDERIQVNCNSIVAELFKSKFGSGSKGKCIRLISDDDNSSGEKWLTPIEFESYCGKGTCKDWKKTIRVGGLPLAQLIDENVLLRHALSCSCSVCNNNSKLSGPIKPFSKHRRPEKRKIKDALKKFMSLKPPMFLKSSLAQKINHLESHSSPNESLLSDKEQRSGSNDDKLKHFKSILKRVEREEKEQWLIFDQVIID